MGCPVWCQHERKKLGILDWLTYSVVILLTLYAISGFIVLLVINAERHGEVEEKYDGELRYHPIKSLRVLQNTFQILLFIACLITTHFIFGFRNIVLFLFDYFLLSLLFTAFLGLFIAAVCFQGSSDYHETAYGNVHVFYKSLMTKELLMKKFSDFQKKNKCCGVFGFRDYNLMIRNHANLNGTNPFNTCCINQTVTCDIKILNENDDAKAHAVVHKNGCKSKLDKLIEKFYVGILIENLLVALVILILLILLPIMSFCAQTLPKIGMTTTMSTALTPLKSHNSLPKKSRAETVKNVSVHPTAKSSVITLPLKKEPESIEESVMEPDEETFYSP